MSEESVEAQGTTRVEVRPGLTMIKRRTLKEDGRYLVYYDFDRGNAPSEPVAAPAQGNG